MGISSTSLTLDPAPQAVGRNAPAAIASAPANPSNSSPPSNKDFTGAMHAADSQQRPPASATSRDTDHTKPDEWATATSHPKIRAERKAASRGRTEEAAGSGANLPADGKPLPRDAAQPPAQHRAAADAHDEATDDATEGKTDAPAAVGPSAGAGPGAILALEGMAKVATMIVGSAAEHPFAGGSRRPQAVATVLPTGAVGETDVEVPVTPSSATPASASTAAPASNAAASPGSMTGAQTGLPLMADSLAQVSAAQAARDARRAAIASSALAAGAKSSEAGPATPVSPAPADARTGAQVTWPVPGMALAMADALPSTAAPTGPSPLPERADDAVTAASASTRSLQPLLIRADAAAAAAAPAPINVAAASQASATTENDPAALRKADAADAGAGSLVSTGMANGAAPAAAGAHTDFSAALASAGAGASQAAQANPAAPAPLKLHPAIDTPQFTQALTDKVAWLVDKDIGSARLSINPPQLGPIDVRVEVSGDKAQVFLSAHSVVTRDALEASSPRLREVLGATGFTQVSVDISHRSFQDRAPARQEWVASPREVREDSVAAVSPAARRGGPGALDAYA